MNSQIYNFLAILNTVIHHDEGEKVPRLNEPVDWEFLSRQARKQNLLPLFFEGAQGFDSYQNYSGYGRDLQDAMIMVAVQIQKSKAFLDLYTKLSEQGISPIVFKGIVMRQLYGTYREHRVSGDEDILIRPEEYERVREILENEGYRCTRPDLTKQQIHRMHEITFYNEEKDFSIEVHLNIIGKENSERTYMNDIFADVFDQTERIDIDGVFVEVMKPTQSFLFLVLHGFKHFQLGGMGIRPMLDVLMYKDAYNDRIDMKRIQEPLRKTHADLFLGDMFRIGQQYFQMPFEAQTMCCPQELLEDLIESGIFGVSQKTDALASNIQFSLSTLGVKRGKMSAFIAGAFPPGGQLVEAYPYLVEKPWLLPLAWIQRFRKFAKYAGKDMGGIVHETLEKVGRRETIFRKYKI